MENKDDPQMVKDANVCEVVKQLDQACRETGFFYAVLLLFTSFLLKLDCIVTFDFDVTVANSLL